MFVQRRTNKMGYLSSLLNRKYRGYGEDRYAGIQKEYADFLIAEDEEVREIKTVLFPLDYFVRAVPDEVYSLLKLYKAEVTLIYVTDSDIACQIKDTLGENAMSSFLENRESYGRELLDKIYHELSARDLKAAARMITGDISQTVENISKDYDLIAVSKAYGGGRCRGNEMSPLSQRLVHNMKTAALIY